MDKTIGIIEILKSIPEKERIEFLQFTLFELYNTFSNEEFGKYLYDLNCVKLKSGE